MKTRDIEKHLSFVEEPGAEDKSKIINLIEEYASELMPLNFNPPSYEPPADLSPLEFKKLSRPVAPPYLIPLNLGESQAKMLMRRDSSPTTSSLSIDTSFGPAFTAFSFDPEPLGQIRSTRKKGKVKTERESENKDMENISYPHFTFRPLSLPKEKEALSLLKKKLTAANHLRTLIRSCNELFLVRKSDQQYDRQSPPYRQLYAFRFNLLRSILGPLLIDFEELGLDTKLLERAQKFSKCAQRSISSPGTPEAYTEKELSSALQHLIADTDSFCGQLDQEYIFFANTVAQRPPTPKAIAVLDEALYQAHLEFCQYALLQLFCANYEALTAKAIEYVGSLEKLSPGKTFCLTKEKMLTDLSAKMDMTLGRDELLIGAKFFSETLEGAQQRSHDQLIEYVLNLSNIIDPKKAKEKEAKHGTSDPVSTVGLQNHHLHAGSNADTRQRRASHPVQLPLTGTTLTSQVPQSTLEGGREPAEREKIQPTLSSLRPA